MALTAPPGGGSNVTGGQAFVDEASTFVGDPYVYGAAGPTSFDCSGLVYYVAQQLGLTGVPRSSEEQWSYVQKISASQLQPGDLVFYTFPYETPPGHVTIYAGNGQIIEAAQTGVPVHIVPMYGGEYGYGRIPGISKASIDAALAKVTGSGSSGAPGPGPNPNPGGGLFGWVGNVFDDVFKASSPAFDLSGVSGVSDVAQALTGLSAPFIKIGEAVDWFWNPTHWVRIGCLVGGTVFTLMGIVTMSRTGRSYAVSNPVGGASAAGFSLPSQIPAPGGQLAPALGIAEVTVGAILLFLGFHNIPDKAAITGIPSFFGYLTAAAHGKKVSTS